MLPTASPAHAEVLASRLLTYGRWLDYAFYMAFGIVAFTSVDLDVGDIARSAERHKNHHLVDACQGIAFGGHIGYLHPLKQDRRAAGNTATRWNTLFPTANG